MPVIRPTGRGEPLATLRGHLAELLAQELLGERSRRGPVIFEIPAEPDKVDVLVIWEAWKSLPAVDRGAVIRDAYSRYKTTIEGSIHVIDPSKKVSTTLVPAVMMATGATPDEAITEGLLPCAVSANARAGEVDFEDVQLLMIDAGAIPTKTGLQLRFPDGRIAADVHARLVEEMPEAHWAIVEQLGTVDDWSHR